MKRSLLVAILAAYVAIAITGCAHKGTAETILKSDIEDISASISTIASARFSGYTDEVKQALTNVFSNELNTQISTRFEAGFTDNFISLEGEIRTVEQNLIEQQTQGLIENPDGTYSAVGTPEDEGKTDITVNIKKPEEFGPIDPNIETVNGIRGIYSGKLGIWPDGTAEVIIYGKVVTINVGTQNRLAYLVGNRNYDFGVKSYNLFENNTLLVTLETKDFTPGKLEIDNPDSGPSEVTEPGVTNKYTLIIKGTLDPETLKFTPTDESLKLLTEEIDTHTLGN